MAFLLTHEGKDGYLTNSLKNFYDSIPRAGIIAVHLTAVKTVN